MTTKSSRLTPEREKEIREIIFNKENVPLPGAYFVAGYDLLQEIDALRAELAAMAKLKENYQNGYDRFKSRTFRVEKEADRLREALEYIADQKNADHPVRTVMNFMAVARDALHSSQSTQAAKESE